MQSQEQSSTELNYLTETKTGNDVLDNYIACRSESAVKLTKEFLSAFLVEYARGTSASKIVESLLSSSPSALIDKIPWMKADPEPELAHLNAIAKIVVEDFTNVIEVENVFFGMMMAPADIVAIENGILMLVDYTSDKSKANVEKKHAALESLGQSLVKKFPGVRYEANVLHYDKPDRQVVYSECDEYDLNELEEFQFCLSEKLAEHAETLTNEEKVSFIKTCVKTAEKTKASVAKSDVYMKIAQSKASALEISEFLATASSHYPKTVGKLMEFLSWDIDGFSRGMTVPREDSEPFSNESFGAAGVINKALDSEEGDVFYFDKNMYEADSTEFAVSFKNVGGGYFKYCLKNTEGLEDNWAQLFKRDKTPKARFTKPNVISYSQAATKIEDAEAEFESFCDNSSLDLPSLADRASKLPNDVFTGAAAQVPSIKSSKLLKDYDSTKGAKVLSLSRIIARNCLQAARSMKNCVHISKSIGGRVLQVSKVTGPLTSFKATSTIVYVNDPEELNVTAIYEMKEGYAVSKALFYSNSMIEWFSEAPGAAAFSYSAFRESSESTVSTYPDVSAAVSMLAVANRKPLAVALSYERQYILSSSSLYSEMDELADKLDVTPLSVFEQLLLSRMLIRSLGIAMERDTQTLRNIYVKFNGGPKTIAITPVLSASGMVNSTGILNLFYDGSVTSGDSRSLLKECSAAYESAIKGAKIVSARSEEDKDLNRCCSNATYEAWLEGRLEEYLENEEYKVPEAAFAKKLQEKKEKYTCSFFSIIFAASMMEKSTSLNDLAYSVSKQTPSDILTTKKAMSTQNSKKFNDYSVFTNMEQAFEGRIRGEVNNSRMELINSKDASITNYSTTTAALVASLNSEPMKVYTTAKTGSIEKTRDLGMLGKETRPLQYFVDKVSALSGAQTSNSRLSSKSKIKVMQQTMSTFPKQKALISACTDVSTYGPSKYSAALYGVLLTRGLSGELREVYKKYFKKLSDKRLIPANVLMNAKESDLAILDKEIVKLIKDCRRKKYPIVSVGTMQGLTQSTSDLLSSAKSLIIDIILMDTFSMAKSLSTNDDGITFVSATKNTAFADAAKIASILESVGFLMGEVVNMAKLSISTVIRELNTQMIMNGRPSLPFVRGGLSCAGVSTIASVRLSAINAMNKMNDVVAEGGTMTLATVGARIAWAAHYERFRCIENAVNGVFETIDPYLLGPPIYMPGLILTLGSDSMRDQFMIVKGYNPSYLADRKISNEVSKSPMILDLASWSNLSADETDHVLSIDYVFTCFPSRKELGDSRVGLVDMNKKPCVEKFSETSLSTFIRRGAEVMKGIVSDDPFRPISCLHAEASMSFSVENLRISKIVTNSKLEVTRQSLNYAKFIEDIKTPVEFFAFELNTLKTQIIEDMGIASEVLLTISYTDTPLRRKMAKTLLSNVAVDIGMTEEDKYSLAISSASDEIRPTVRFLSNFKGYTGSEVMEEYDASLLEESYEHITTTFRAISSTFKTYVRPVLMYRQSEIVSIAYASLDITCGNPYRGTYFLYHTSLAGTSVKEYFETSTSATVKSQLKTCALESIQRATGLKQSFTPSMLLGYAVKPFIKTSEYGSVSEAIFKSVDSGMPIQYSNDLMAYMTKCDCAVVLRKGVEGKAVAKEVHTSVGVDKRRFISARIREDAGSGFAHSVVVLTMDDVKTVSRKRKRAAASSKNEFLIDDMKVKISKPPDLLNFSINYYPPAVCLETEYAPIPIQDLNAEMAESSIRSNYLTDSTEVDLINAYNVAKMLAPEFSKASSSIASYAISSNVNVAMMKFLEHIEVNPVSYPAVSESLQRSSVSQKKLIILAILESPIATSSLNSYDRGLLINSSVDCEAFSRILKCDSATMPRSAAATSSSLMDMIDEMDELNYDDDDLGLDWDTCSERDDNEMIVDEDIGIEEDEESENDAGDIFENRVVKASILESMITLMKENYKRRIGDVNDVIGFCNASSFTELKDIFESESPDVELLNIVLCDESIDFAFYMAGSRNKKPSWMKTIIRESGHKLVKARIDGKFVF